MMHLYLNATSPYARVARVAALEQGLADAVDLRWCDPWADGDDLLSVNPVGRVPALVTPDGVALTESLLIVRYLDAVGHGDDLFPAATLDTVLSLAGLGYGLMEAAFNTVIARKHHGPEADETVLGRRRLRAMDRTLPALARHPAAQGSPGRVTVADIVGAVSLDYVAFRLPNIDWPGSYPALARWHAAVTDRDSFRQTRFPVDRPPPG
ncbi:glutathione S-transferase family protein [Roseospira visakhapatnamensis]|uniref:Glutathione S-transferase n=1 Tax=Roseospira visakhapatnamensis TaxID=390880 RepID=A0A7W6WA82_9PROT|nr:glutathione S-transferase family protein [Roseospira visakhapatnamensis]MBB4266583.1 glutathione S-transferase [Roseospira visakhapatnamensis]